MVSLNRPSPTMFESALLESRLILSDSALEFSRQNSGRKKGD